MINKIESTLDSREVAKMIGKEHKAVMRDIRRYTSQLNGCNLAPVEFFKENTYYDGKGEMRPCYQITRKGCEFIAHKLTGTKGTEFTARYINRFHEMEEQLRRNRKSDKPWYIREFRGKNIMLYRDFEELTGINPVIYGYNCRPKYRRTIGGIDYNGWDWKCDREEFYNEYGFDYGEDSCMMYLTMIGLQKVLKFMYEECEQKEYRIAQNMIEELGIMNIKKREERKKAESQPVQISITINGGNVSDVEAITTALAKL